MWLKTWAQAMAVAMARARTEVRFRLSLLHIKVDSFFAG